MKISTDNFSAFYYKTDRRQEFKITYKIPTKSEIKQWWSKLWKRKKSKK